MILATKFWRLILFAFVTKTFYLGRFEVTQAQWQAVMGQSPSRFKGDARPVERVSWNDAQDFIAKLNARKDGYNYRLPRADCLLHSSAEATAMAEGEGNVIPSEISSTKTGHTSSQRRRTCSHTSAWPWLCYRTLIPRGN